MIYMCVYNIYGDYIGIISHGDHIPLFPSRPPRRKGRQQQIINVPEIKTLSGHLACMCGQVCIEDGIPSLN